MVSLGLRREFLNVLEGNNLSRPRKRSQRLHNVFNFYTPKIENVPKTLPENVKKVATQKLKT